MMTHKEGNAYYINPFDAKRFEGEYYWLLGTINHGMIICEGLVTKEEFENGTAFEIIGQHTRMTPSDEYKCLKWYVSDNYRNSGVSACLNQYMHYYKMLMEKPELVYMTLDDLKMFCRFREVTAGGKIVPPENRNSHKQSSKTECSNKFADFVRDRMEEQIEELRSEAAGIESDEPADEDSCRYYIICKKDKDEERRILQPKVYLDYRQFPVWAEAMEEIVLRMLALRDANQMIANENWKDNPWKLSECAKGFGMKLYKEDDNNGELEIFLFLSKKKRLEALYGGHKNE